MKLKKIKLSALADASMHQKEMNAIIGGDETCGCGCEYEDKPGGSNFSSNLNANYLYKYVSNTCNIVEYVYNHWEVVCRPKAN